GGVQDRRSAVGERAQWKIDSAFAGRDINVAAVAGGLILGDGVGVSRGPPRRIDADDPGIRHKAPPVPVIWSPMPSRGIASPTLTDPPATIVTLPPFLPVPPVSVGFMPPAAKMS